MQSLPRLSLTLLADLRKPTRLFLAFDIGILLLVSTAFSFGQTICRLEPAEDLVLVINSLTHPTFYYPGSNRIANLVGYAASWISDVGANYQFQLFLRIFFATAWPYLAFRLVLQRCLCLLATLVFHSIVLFQFHGFALHVVYGGVDPYCTSFFLLFLALLIFQKWDVGMSGGCAYVALLAAFILALVASGVAQTNTVFILLVLGAYYVTDFLREMYVAAGPTLQPAKLGSALKRILKTGTIYRRGLVLVLLGAALLLAALHGSLYAKMYPEAVRSFSSTSYINFHLNPKSVLRTATNLWNVSGGFALLLEFVAPIILVALLRSHRNWRHSSAGATMDTDSWFVAVIGGGLVYLMMISQLSHVQANNYHPRYFMVLSLCTVFLFVTFTLNRLANWLFDATVARQARSHAVLAAGTCFALLFSLSAGAREFGPPTIDCPFSDSTSMKSGLFASKGGYFAILGSYWDVWPSVFNAWKAAGHQSIESRVFPTGFRAETFEPKIRDEAIKRLLHDGSIKLLCVGKNKFAPDFGRVTDCVQLAEWNRAWGILPGGQYLETDNQLGDGFADVIVTLPKVAVGDRLEFSAAAKPKILLSGWSSPEDFGTWTEGTDAVVAFNMSCTKPEKLALELHMAAWIGAFIPNPQPLNVDVFWNEKKVFDWVYSKERADAVQAGIIPSDLIQCGHVNVVRLKIHSPQSLKSLGINLDQRILGIAVKSLSITAAGR